MKLYKTERELLGSKITITVCEKSERESEVTKAIEKAFLECARIERRFSRFLPQSELSLLNTQLNLETPVSDELFLLISFAEEIKKSTAGIFDITIKSILEGWGYDAGYSLREQTAGKIGEVVLNAENRTVTSSAEIDLGGVGKGYALDRMLAIFASFENIVLDAGGDIYARGKDENGNKWKILFEDPMDITRAIGEVEADGFFLAASSPSRRRWRNRHHLVDPRHGEPADKMLMTYIQADRGIIADTLSTALFVMGWEDAQKALPNLGIEAMLVSPEGKIFRSGGFSGTLYLEPIQ